MPAHSTSARTGPPAITPVPGRGGLEQHDAGAVLAGHLVRDRRAHHRDLEHLALGLLDALLRSRPGPPGLAVADADPAGAVADDDERGEREPAATLDDLRHAVDRDHPLLVRCSSRLCVVVSAHQILQSLSLSAPSASGRDPAVEQSPPRSNTTGSTPASFARSASSLADRLGTLGLTVAARLDLAVGGATQRPRARRRRSAARRCAGWIGTRRAAAARRCRRSSSAPGVCRRTRAWRLGLRHPSRGSAFAALPRLLADVLALVPDALALVGLGLADLPDLGGHLADQLLVDAAHRRCGWASGTSNSMPSGAGTATGCEKPTASSRSLPLHRGPVADAMISRRFSKPFVTPWTMFAMSDAGQPVQARGDLALVARALDADRRRPRATIVISGCKRWLERAPRALHGHDASRPIVDVDARRDLDGCLSDS